MRGRAAGLAPAAGDAAACDTFCEAAGLGTLAFAAGVGT